MSLLLNLVAFRAHAQVTGEREMLALYQAVDVVLDTYPAGSYITSLQVGIPCTPLVKKELIYLPFSDSQADFLDTLGILGTCRHGTVSSPYLVVVLWKIEHVMAASVDLNTT